MTPNFRLALSEMAINKRQCLTGMPLIERFILQMHPAVTGCWLWKGAVTGNGYGAISPGLNSSIKTKVASRMAYELAIGKIPQGMLCCHKCDNRLCVNPSHLFLGYHKDNNRDAREKKRTQIGSGVHNSKLTESSVVEIKRLLKAGQSQRQLAKRYEVSQPAISNMVRGKTWTHVLEKN